MVEKKTRRKRIFYSCGTYPKCDFAVWQRPVPQPCPTCGGMLTLNGPRGTKCSQCQAEFEMPEEQAVAVQA